MGRNKDLLIEIGTEELPPKALRSLSEAFARGVLDALNAAGLEVSGHAAFATPRRLAMIVHELPAQQAEQCLERRGPALAAAFGSDGSPTPAALGFARSCGVDIAALERLETDKGSWLVHRQRQPGRQSVDLIPGIVDTALAGLPIPKRMRWGDSDAEFVRPVHWLVLLYGEQLVPARIMGIEAGRHTRGHRFHCPDDLELTDPGDYVRLLSEQGHVLPDFDVRRQKIEAQVQAAAAALDGRAVIDPELLDEVTALVEWPVAVTGHFEARFLEVPQEALISTMQGNQKYFPVVDARGRLMPHFITISNIDSRDPSRVREGNERVIRPRFADAGFFWDQDRRVPLDSHLDALGLVVFQHRLGSLRDKTLRVERLAGWLAGAAGASPEQARRAARLSKCDLQTQMVFEFTELQGIMGRYYALHDGEPEAVALALEEQYLPRHAGDRLPSSAEGRVLALADRLDTLVGIFAIGQKPTGAKDPFGLRRAALGVMRILLEARLPLDLAELLQLAAAGYPGDVPAEAAVFEVLEYMLDRLRAHYLDQGIRPEVFEAVLAVRPTRPLDFDGRVRAVAHFLTLPEAESLVAAHKRIHNILRKRDDEPPDSVDTALMREPAEVQLHQALVALRDEVGAELDAGRYTEGLTALASLRVPVDAFFDTVMVMAEDAALRDNRLALLQQLSGLFLRVADLSRLA